MGRQQIVLKCILNGCMGFDVVGVQSTNRSLWVLNPLGYYKYVCTILQRAELIKSQLVVLCTTSVVNCFVLHFRTQGGSNKICKMSK